MASRAKYMHYSLPTKHKLLVFLSMWLLLLLFLHSSSQSLEKTKHCDKNIAHFYIHDLPPRFNSDLLCRCRSLSSYTDMCPHVANRGLGRRLNATWHATHQFIAEMIFHARAERHPCRTSDPDSAEMFYVPFYGGLYASSRFREANRTLRDELAVDLAEHLVSRSAWRQRNGHDHVLVIGRTAWDFMRSDQPGSEDFGANGLFLLPPISNMSVLTVERHPWQGHNQFGIPYPSYFHPRTAADMASWQSSIRRSIRTHLFSFVGGPRVGIEKAAVRSEILRQCGESARCIRVECEPGSINCHEPARVIEVMKRADFCLQPPGDSFTRRSVFDSVLAGCVPVFFSEHTAYTQYEWFLPGRREDWSVFIEPERSGQIEQVLDRISRVELHRMRENVIELIPKVTYAHPNASLEDLGFHDVVDLALIQLTKRLRSTDRIHDVR